MKGCRQISQSEKIIVKGFSNAFEHMCNFMAVAKTGKPNETIQGLIQLCFVLKPEERFSTNIQFVEQIEQSFGLVVPEHQIQEAVNAMIKSGILSMPVGTNIVFDKNIRRKIEERIKESHGLEERVKESWLKSIDQKYPELPIERMWPTLQSYLSKAFRRHGMQTAYLLDPLIDTPEEYTESLSQLLMEVIEDKFEIKERTSVKQAVSAFLGEVAMDTERSEYIAQLADGAFNFYSLEVSPDLKEKLQSNLNEIILFLDTNFLFGILGLHNNPQVEVSNALIRAITTYKLPFRLRYHDATEREMRNTISYYSDALKKRKWTRSSSRAAIKAGALSGLELKYHEKNAIQQIDVAEFLRTYQHLDILLEEKGIDIIRSTENRLQERADLHVEYETFLEKHGKEDKFYEAIEHDVTVLDEVRRRRSDSPSTLDAGALLVSCDYSLNLFDHETAHRNNHMVCVVLPNNFWQILRPFIPSDRDFERSFAQTFAISEFRAIGSKGSKACSKMFSILATYKDVPEETAFKMLSNGVLLDKLKTTTDDNEFAEYVEAAVVEENKNLLEEKAAMAKQLEKEKKAKAGMEKAAAEKLQVLERESIKLQKTLSMRESEIESAKAIVETSQEEHKETKRELDKIKEIVNVEKANRIKVEKEKEKQKSTYQLIVAIAISILLVVLFEGGLHFYKWSWLWKHPNSIGLEVGIDLLVVFVVFGTIVSRWRKWFFIAIVLPIILVLISILGGRT